MQHRTNTIFENNIFKLVKNTNPKSRRVNYTVSILPSSYWLDSGIWNNLDEVRKLFDPGRNRSGRTGTKWKFRSRKEAEQLISFALLKWSSKE